MRPEVAVGKKTVPTFRRSDILVLSLRYVRVHVDVSLRGSWV